MKSRLLIISFLLIGLELAYAQPYNSVLWQKKSGPSGGEIKDIEYDPSSGKVFAIAGNRRKLYISTDGGDTWVEKTGSGNFSSFNDIEIASNTVYLITSFGVWSSGDGGVNFTEIASNQFDFNNANRIKRLSTGRLVVLTNNGIFYSTNDGVDWSPGYQPSTGFLDGAWLVANAADQLFVIKDQTPYRSNDFGVNFTAFSTGIAAGAQIFSLAANNSGSGIYCTTASDIFVSDGSSSWSSIKGGSMTDAAINDFSNAPSFLEFSADGLGIYFMDNVNQKLHSKGVGDGPGSWELRQSAFPSATLDVLNATAKDYPTANTSTVFFGTEAGIYKTTSGATTFAESNTGIAGLSSDQLLVNNFDALFMLRGFSSGIIRSTDNGNNWSKLTSLAVSSIYHFTQNITRNMLYAATDDGPYRSLDGTSWTAIPLPGSVFTSQLFAPAEDQLFALYGRDFYHSMDQGTSWTPSSIEISGLPSSISIDEMAFLSSDVVILNLRDFDTDTDRMYRVDLAYSGGVLSTATATEITNLPVPEADIDDLYAVNDKVYVTTFNDQLVISEDKGVSWQLRSLGSVSNTLVAYNGYVFTTESGTKRVNISRDDGATFQTTTMSSSTQVGSIRDIEIDDDGIAYLAFDGDFIHASSKTIVVPNAPSNVAEVGNLGNALAIAWDDNSSDEEQFEIFRSTDGVNFTNVGTSFDNSCNTPNGRGFFTMKNTEPNTTYTIRVKAENEAGSSPYASIVVTTPEEVACVQAIPDNRSWSAVNSGDSGFPIVAAQTVGIIHLGGGRYQISDIALGLLSGSPFFESDGEAVFYESCGETFVDGTNADEVRPNGNGTWNGVSELTLKWRTCSADEYETIVLTLEGDTPEPIAPTNPLAYSYTNSSIEVNWQTDYFQNSFIIERSLDGSTGWVQAGTVDYPATRFVDNGPLTPGTTYYYRIKALNGDTPADESPYSAVTSVLFISPKFVLADNNITNTITASLGSYWADFNNDGFQDYLTLSYDPDTERGMPTIFQNGGDVGDFTQIIPTLDAEQYFGASIGDYDNDGNTDILLTGQETTVADLYRGNGDFTFSKVSAGTGDLATVTGENISIQATSWTDINNDGLLDLLVLGRNSDVGDGMLLLFRQNTDHSFTRITGGEMASDILLATGGFWSDYNNDGYQDVIISNSNGALRLYENNGDETFTKRTGNGFDASGAISVSWGDYNNDGFMDIFAGSSTQHALYKNNGDETFTKDVSTSVSDAGQTAAEAWGDFNNDGYLDLISGGFIGTPARLFIRDASNPSVVAFFEIVTEKINDFSVFHYGASVSDYDKNGYMDIGLSSFLFTGSDEIGLTNIGLFRNNIMTGNWSEVKLNPTSGNKEGIGAKVRLTANGITQTREIPTTSATFSRSSTIPHFGIGSASTISNIQVQWANGDIQNYSNPPANQILTIDQDSQGPDISAQVPIHGSIDINTSTTFSITLDEVSSPVAGKSLLFYMNNDFANLISGIDVTDAQVSGNTYTFTLPEKLLTSTVYHIGIEEGAFVDIYGNPSPVFPSGEWTFTTSPGPQVGALTPADGATGVFANTTIAIEFDLDILAVAATTIDLFIDPDLTTPVYTLNTEDGVITGNIVTFTLPSSLERLTLYHVSVPAGVFTDLNGNDFGGINWSFTTDGGPEATFSPENGAVDVPVDEPLVVTFESTVDPVAGKKIIVIDDLGNSVLNVDVSVNGTTVGGVYTLPAPVGNWPNNTTLHVSVDAGAFTDADANDFAGIVSDNWTFTTVEAADVTPPEIVLNPAPPQFVPKGFNTSIQPIDVRDDKQVATVVLNIKKISDATYTQVNATPGAEPNMWNVTLSESSHFDATGAEFFITATDLAGNEARNPEGSETKTVFLNYTGQQAAIPSNHLGLGGQKSNWKVFSIPFVIPSPNNAVTAIMDEITGTEKGLQNKIDYRLLTINSTGTDWSEYPTFAIFERGKGYFINIKQDPGVIDLPDNVTTPQNTRSDLFELTLQPGWNMIGNPYLTPINWDNVATISTLTGTTAALVKFSAGTYSEGNQTLEPFEGAFVNNASTTPVAVTIPFLGQTESGGRKGVSLFSADIAADEWLLKLNLSQADITYGMGAIGMSPEGSPTLDNYDAVTPPRFFDYLELNFDHPEHFQKRFTRDIVPTQNRYTWEFSVASNLEGMAELNWDNLPLQNSGRDLFLLDIAGQKLINMKESGSYLFDPKESSNFRIYFGENLSITPERVQLGKAYPNPTTGFSKIAFSLPETGGLNQSVSLDIMDAMGRTAGTITQGRFNPGYHETSFDARDLTNGFYTYRLTVQGKNGRTIEVNKLIIK